MTDSDRYVDRAAYEEYLDNDGQEVIVSQLIPGEVGEVFDAWIQQVWIKPFEEIQPGTGRGYVGHKRRVNLGITEQIVSAGVPSEQSNNDLIPSICYKLRDFGPMSMKDHIGFVAFVRDSTAPPERPATLVLWTVKSTPTTLGNVLLCGGSITRLLIRAALQHFLSSFAAETQKSKHV